MTRVVRFVFFCALSLSLFAAETEWRNGIQTAFPNDQWTNLLGDLREVHLNRGPYRITKRTRVFDHEVRIVTPFAAAAEKVQGLRGGARNATYEHVAKELAGTRLLVKLHTMCRSQPLAEAVTIALRVDGRSVQPILDRLEMSQLKSVGFYAEPFYIVDRTFFFELSEIVGAKAVSVLVFEDEGEAIELPVDVPALR